MLKIVSLDNAGAVVVEGEQFNAADDGTFEVPDHIAVRLTTFPEWEIWQAPEDEAVITVVASPSPDPVQPQAALEAAQAEPEEPELTEDEQMELPAQKADLVAMAKDLGLVTYGSAKDIADRILAFKALEAETAPDKKEDAS